VFTRTRASKKQHSPKFFPAKSNVLEFWSLLWQSHVNKRSVSFSNFPHHWIKSITV
jgi:hypothetical protein